MDFTDFITEVLIRNETTWPGTSTAWCRTAEFIRKTSAHLTYINSIGLRSFSSEPRAKLACSIVSIQRHEPFYRDHEIWIADVDLAVRLLLIHSFPRCVKSEGKVRGTIDIASGACFAKSERKGDDFISPEPEEGREGGTLNKK